MSFLTLQRVSTLLLCAALGLSLAACRLPSPRSRASLSAPTPVLPAARITLPRDWPLPELSAPAGAVDAELPCHAPAGFGDKHMIIGMPFNVGTNEEGRMWRAGFAYDGGFDKAMQHVESCVKPLGFYLYWQEDGRGREYISPDGRFLAQVYYWPEENVYHLQVSRYTHAWHPDAKGQAKSI